MTKVKCGDANPNGNVWFKAKGGCMEELDIKDAYRCTGCGVFFHLDCIFEHFEQEEGHDYARNSLKNIRDLAVRSLVKNDLRPMDVQKIISFADEGLDRKPEARRVKI